MTPEQLGILIGFGLVILSGFIVIRFTVNWLMSLKGPTKMPPIKHVRNWHDQPGVK